MGLAGLKCGSGERRILRRFPISVGAAHWAARGFRALHMFLQPCMGDPCGRPSEPYRFSTNFPGLGRGGPWTSRWGVCMPRKHPHPSGLRPDTFPLSGGRLERAGLGPAPTANDENGFTPSSGPVPDRPAKIRTGSVGSANPGAVVEPHRVLIFANSGPSGPEGIAEVTQILRAGNFLPVPRDNPRNGGSRGWGSWRMRRSRIRLAPPPSAFLVTFWASKKSLAARRRRNPPRKTAETARRGRRALQGIRNLPPHPAPSGPPSPQGEGFKGAVKSPCLMKKTAHSNRSTRLTSTH